jgi:hypothetical protein
MRACQWQNQLSSIENNSRVMERVILALRAGKLMRLNVLKARQPKR